MEKKNMITKENIVRIRDEKVLEKLNNVYDKYKDIVYTSKNNFLIDVIKLGVDVLEKQEKDNWAIKNEKQTLLDAIHEHTKRMNYFIKFSKPFIQTTYADSEINQQLLCLILNYLIENMDDFDKRHFLNDLQKHINLPEVLERKKSDLRANYLYKVE